MEKEIERTYNIPLRKELLKVPRYKRAKKAIISIRAFLKRHMKSDDIKLGSYLNKEITKRGRENIPHHIKVKVLKDKENKVKAELFSAPVDLKTKEEKPKETKKLEEKIKTKEIPKQEKEKEKKEREKKEVLEEPRNIKKKKGKRIEHEKPLTPEEEEKIRKEEIVSRRDKKEAVYA